MNENIRRNVTGLRIQEARLMMNIDQQELADRLCAQGLHITQEMVSRMETGVRKVFDYELVIISRVFQRPLSWFFGE